MAASDRIALVLIVLSCLAVGALYMAGVAAPYSLAQAIWAGVTIGLAIASLLVAIVMCWQERLEVKATLAGIRGSR